MVNHPNRRPRNAMFIQNGCAILALSKDHIIYTTKLNPGYYVKIDDSPTCRYPQLCYGGARRGNTLIYNTDAALARDCRARLYKTREKFDAAVAEMDREHVC